MKVRHRVLGFLSLLSVITYLDRVCMSIAGPRMQEALSLGPEQWGWVTGVFTLAYALFEIPSGSLGDRIGPRRVLTRIVLWWSAFTSLTGAVFSFIPLVVIRFAFGMGEAGAYPNINGGITLGQPALMGICLDIGGTFGGAITGAMNTAAYTGAFLSSVIYGNLVARYGYTAPFIPMILLMAIGTALGLLVNATEQVIPD